MKILIMSQFDFQNKELKICNLKSQMDIYLFNIVKYLQEKTEVELIFADCLNPGWSKRIVKEHTENLIIPEADHCLVVSQRGIADRPPIFYEMLRSKISGFICTFSSSVCKVGQEDVLFYCIPEGKKNKKNCKLMHWAANEDICKPKHNKRMLRILIDHSYYNMENKLADIDISDKVLYDVCNFARNYERKYMEILQKKYGLLNYVKVVVRRLCSGGVETIDIDNPYIDYFNKKGLSYEDVCKEYCHTDIYVVTHLECMGLSVLESAMAGALIISAKNGVYNKWNIPHQIRPSLLHKLHHVEYDAYESIPWDKVMEEMDVKRSREKALKFTWEKSVNIIYDVLENSEFYKRKKLIFANESVGNKYFRKK